MSPTHRGRKSPGSGAVDVEGLMEENVSLKYQVQKLQQALVNGRQQGERGATGAGWEGDEKKFEHQIKRLQTFMNEHSTQKLALKERLRVASDYVGSWEPERERRAVPAAKASGRGAARISAGAGPKTPRRKARQGPAGSPGASAVSDKVRGALGSTLAQSRRGAKAPRPLPPTPSPLRGPPSHAARSERKKSGAAAGTASAAAVTPEDLECIFEEVLSLKQKLALAESKLQLADLQSQPPPAPAPAPAQAQGKHPKRDEALKEEMREMRASQAALQQQIKAQQDVLTDIFKHLSSATSANPSAGANANANANAGARAGVAAAYAPPPATREFYATRHPVYSMHPTVRANTSLSLADKLEKSGRAKKRKKKVVKCVRFGSVPTRMSRKREQDQKFALLSQGYSTAFLDEYNDPLRHARARALEDAFEDFGPAKAKH